MEEQRGTFDLRRLFGCVTCFAIAFGFPYFASFLIDYENLDLTMRWSLATVCVYLMGGCIGGGIGLLFNRFWRGAAWGSLGILLMCLAIFPFVAIFKA